MDIRGLSVMESLSRIANLFSGFLLKVFHKFFSKDTVNIRSNTVNG